MLYSNILLPLFVEDQFEWMQDVANIYGVLRSFNSILVLVLSILGQLESGVSSRHLTFLWRRIGRAA